MSIRIYALSKQLNVETRTLIDAVKDIGIPGKRSAMASLTSDEAHKVMEYFGLLPPDETTDGADKFVQKKKMDETTTVQILTDSKIVIDTCFAMDACFQDLLETHADIFRSNKIIIPLKVVHELENIRNKNDGRFEIADQAYRTIARAKKEDLIQLAEDKTDDLMKTADQVIHSAVQKLLLRYDVLVCTQDISLARDLYSITAAESFSIKHKLHVVRRYKKGKLFPVKRRDVSFPKDRSEATDDRDCRSVIPYSSDDIRPFSITSIISADHRQRLQVHESISAGAIIYTKDKQPVSLEEELARGGEGMVFAVKNSRLVAKIYFNERLTKGTQEKIELMVSRKVPNLQICWPQTPLYDAQGVFRGFLMPKASGTPLGHGLFIPNAWLKRNPNWTRRESVNLVLSILNKTNLLHEMNIILGDINPLNILVENERDVYFVDCDSYQVEGYPCPVGTANFTPPDIQGKNYSEFLRTKDNELFAIATLLFMIMLPGKAPYSHEGGENGAENIKIGHFPYCLGERSSKSAPAGAWRFCWSHLSWALKEAFDRSFHADHKDKPRVSLDEWMSLFNEYLTVLSSPRRVFSGPAPDYGFDLSILPQSRRYIENKNALPEDGKTEIQRLMERLMRRKFPKH